MAEPKFTPGQWIVDRGDRALGTYVLDTFDAPDLYRRGGMDLLEEVDEANALLIEAAPNLYRELERVEWLGHRNNSPACPACGRYKAYGPEHADDCSLAAALAAARGTGEVA